MAITSEQLCSNQRYAGIVNMRVRDVKDVKDVDVPSVLGDRVGTTRTKRTLTS
jgi:hypothetical protein